MGDKLLVVLDALIDRFIGLGEALELEESGWLARMGSSWSTRPKLSSSWANISCRLAFSLPFWSTNIIRLLASVKLCSRPASLDPAENDAKSTTK